MKNFYAVILVSIGLMAAARIDAADLSSWPPAIGKAYPDLALVDAQGKTGKLSSFKGKVLVIEPIGMNCPACQAWAGAHKVGAFEGVSPQGNLTDIETMFPRYAGGMSLDDPRIVYIQLILFNMQLKSPTADDVRRWSAHFNKSKKRPPVVLAGSAALLDPAHYQATYNLIPGFHLVDKDFVLRSDAAGHQPKNNLWSELLPMVPKLVDTGMP